ncbi:MAG: DUF5615 family PIN-like protein [Thermomicrobiales bacterium]
MNDDLGRTMAACLRAFGHDVVRAKDEQQAGTSDEQHLLTAVRLGRTLVTHNEDDFVLLHRAWVGWPRALAVAWPAQRGILVIPQPSILPAAVAAEEINTLLEGGTDLANRLYLWKRGQGWRPGR